MGQKSILALRVKGAKLLTLSNIELPYSLRDLEPLYYSHGWDISLLYPVFLIKLDRIWFTPALLAHTKFARFHACLVMLQPWVRAFTSSCSSSSTLF